VRTQATHILIAIAAAPVVLLNAGYGVIEIVGGILAGSQALKTDALDFIGDGLISWLGLMAVGWGLAARAKAALLQGIFLGLLGAGVFAATIYPCLFSTCRKRS
jgi:Co/Zn/Cd efflux system component